MVRLRTSGEVRVQLGYKMVGARAKLELAMGGRVVGGEKDVVNTSGTTPPLFCVEGFHACIHMVSDEKNDEKA